MTKSFDNSRPIYLQIVERLTHKIIAGEYAAGQRLASVRDLAAEFGVNPNTLQRAFAELERQDLLYTERTAGRFVTQDVASICAVRQALAQQKVAEFTQQMAQMGYDTAQLLLLLQQNAQQAEQAGTVVRLLPQTDVATQADAVVQPLPQASMPAQPLPQIAAIDTLQPQPLQHTTASKGDTIDE